MVERFFRHVTIERLGQGVFTSVAELEAAIDEYVVDHNTEPKPFIWTKGFFSRKTIRLTLPIMAMVITACPLLKKVAG